MGFCHSDVLTTRLVLSASYPPRLKICLSKAREQELLYLSFANLLVTGEARAFIMRFVAKVAEQSQAKSISLYDPERTTRLIWSSV
jgi:hypothetical protein